MGAVLLLFNGLLLEVNLNLLIVGHAVLALTFAITAFSFKNVKLLGHMFEPMEHVIHVSVPVITKVLGVEPSSISGVPILLEVEPSSKYETAVEDFIVEQQSRKSLVYVFSSSASPVMTAISKLPEVRIFVLTDSVSYAEPTAEAHKTLVPQNHADVIVDLTSRIISANKIGLNSVVFDNLSAMVLALGEQETLKLVIGMLNTLSGGATTSLFLTTRKAHPPDFSLALARLFARKLTYDSAGLREAKQRYSV